MRLIDSKYIELNIDITSWALPLMIDFYSGDIFRPISIQLLCIFISLGKNPLHHIKIHKEKNNALC